MKSYDPNFQYFVEEHDGEEATPFGIPAQDVNGYLEKAAADGRQIRPDNYLKFRDDAGVDYDVPGSRVDDFKTEMAADGRRIAPVVELVHPKTGETRKFARWGADDAGQFVDADKASLANAEAGGWGAPVAKDPGLVDFGKELIKGETWADADWDAAKMAAAGGSAAVKGLAAAEKSAVGMASDVVAAGAEFVGLDPVANSVRAAKQANAQAVDTAADFYSNAIADAAGMDQTDRAAMALAAKPAEEFGGIAGIGGAGKAVSAGVRAVGTGLRAVKDATKLGAQVARLGEASAKLGEAGGNTLAMAASGYESIYDDDDLKPLLESGNSSDRVKAQIIGGTKALANAYGGKVYNKFVGAGAAKKAAEKAAGGFVEKVLTEAVAGGMEFGAFNDIVLGADVGTKAALGVKDLPPMGKLIAQAAGQYVDGFVLGGLMPFAHAAGGGARVAGRKAMEASLGMSRDFYTGYFAHAVEQAARNERVAGVVGAAAEDAETERVSNEVQELATGKGLLPQKRELGVHRFVTPGGITIEYQGGEVRPNRATGETEVVSGGGVVVDNGGERMAGVTAGTTPQETAAHAYMLACGIRSGFARGIPVDPGAISVPEAAANAAPTENKKPIVVLRNDDLSLTLVSGAGRLAAAKARGDGEIQAVVLDSADGWTKDNVGAVNAVENLMDGSIKDGATAVRAIETLGLSRQQLAAGGILKGRVARAAMDVVENAQPWIKKEVADGNCPVHVGQKIANAVSVKSTGLAAESVDAFQADLAARLGGATRAEADAVCWALMDRLGGLTDAAAADPAVRAKLLEEALVVARGEGDVRGAVENGTTLKMEKAVRGTLVETADGKLEKLGALEDQARGGATEAVPEPAAEAPRKDCVLKPAADGTWTCPALPGYTWAVADGRVMWPSEMDAEYIGAHAEEVAELVADLAERFGDGNIDVATERQALALRAALEDRAAASEAAEQAKKDVADLDAYVAVGQQLLDSMFGRGVMHARVGTEAEARAALEEGTGASARAITGKGGEICGYWDRTTKELVLFPGADAATVGHEVVGHALRQFAEENAPGLVGVINKVARAMPAAAKEALRETYGELDAEAFLDELFAGRIEKDVAGRIEKMAAANAEVKTWWQEVKAAVREIVKRFVEAFGGNRVDLEGIEKMAPEDAIKRVVDQVMEGRRLAREKGRDGAQEKMVEETTEVEQGGKRLSLKSWIYDRDNGDMLRGLTEPRVIKKGVVLPPLMKRKEADDLMAGIDRVAGRVAQDAFILDIQEDFGKGGRPFSPWKPNSDPLYKISLDFSTLCKKRLTTQYVIEKLQVAKGEVMMPEQQLAIRELLRQYKKEDKALQIACHLCYVEAARLKAPAQMKKFFADPAAKMRDYFAKTSPDFAEKIEDAKRKIMTKYGLPPDTTKKDLGKKKGGAATRYYEATMKALRGSYEPTAAEKKIMAEAAKMDVRNFLSADNLAKLNREHPEIFNAYTTFVREATHSKGLETEVPYYYGDSKSMTNAFIKKANEQGTGLRHQSWSDFQLRHVLDTIVAVCDLAVRGAKMHAYTKVPEFVNCFGRTGIMINMSLIPELDGKGWSSTEGMDYKTAVKLRDMYPETAGTIAIAMSPEHLIELIRNESIDYVIPYHKSGMNKGLRKMVGIDKWTDFENAQKVHEIKGATKSEEVGDKWQVEPEQSEWLVNVRNGKAAMVASAKKYLALCHARGLEPKFARVPGLLKQNKDGSWSVVKGNEGYWKLLVDHKMINHKTGKLIEQQALRPEFDFAGIIKMMDAEVEKHDDRHMDKAYKYVQDRFDELPQVTQDLKRRGITVEGTLKLAEEAEGKRRGKRAQIKDLPGYKYRAALKAIKVGGLREVMPNENQEQSVGGRASSSELLARERNPVTGTVDPYDAPRFDPKIAKPFAMSGSEVVRLYKLITGGVLPPETVRVKSGAAGGSKAGKMGWTTGDKVTVLKDIFGIIDGTDEAVIHGRLVEMGFFRHEDPVWAATATPEAVAADRAASYDMLHNQLRQLGEDRVNGTASGGQRAAVNVMAANLGRVIVELPNDVGGTVGHLRTIGQGILRGFDKQRTPEQMRYYLDEAAGFLNWWHGQKPGDANEYKADGLSVKSAFGEVFGAFMTAPDAVREHAPGLYRNMLEAVAYSPKLLRAWNEVRTTALGEGAAERVMREIEKRRTWAEEERVRLLEESIKKPIGTGWQRFRDSFAHALSSIEGPLVLHLDRAHAALLRSAKRAVAAGRMTQDQYDALAGRFKEAVTEIKTARLAMDRGRQNEIRSYLWDQSALFERAKRDGVDLRDWYRYGECMRCIELAGRAYEAGMTPREARQVLDGMRRRLGDDGYRKIEDLATEFQSNREQHILDDPRLERAFGVDLMDYWKANVHYIRSEHTLSPEQAAKLEADREKWRETHPGQDDVLVDMLRALKVRGGGGGSAVPDGSTWTHALKGSLRAKKDWFYATLKNDEALLAFAEKNAYVLSIRDALLEFKVPGVHDLPAKASGEWPENARYGKISYFDNGEKRVLVAPRAVTEVFRRGVHAMDAWKGVNQYFHAVLIDYNLAYTVRNLTRNTHSNEANLPGMRQARVTTALGYVAPGANRLVDAAVTQVARHLPDYVFRNPAARVMFGRWTNVWYAGEAQRIVELYKDPRKLYERLDAAKDDPTEVQRVMDDLAALKFCMSGNALISRFQAVRGLGQLDDFMRSHGFGAVYGDAPVERTKLRKALDAATWVFMKNAEVNADLELWAKVVATLQQMDWQKSDDARAIGYRVANAASIPVVENAGALTGQIGQTVQLFYATTRSSSVRYIENVGERPRETLGKMATQSLIPSIAWRVLVAGGGLLAWLEWMYGGDREKLMASKLGGLARYLAGMGKAYKNISEYQHMYYESLPIACWGDTTLSIAMPRTDEEKLLTPMCDWFAKRLSPDPTDPTCTAVRQVGTSILGQLMPDVSGRHPAMAVAQDVMLPVMGVNPQDPYRRTTVYDPDTFAARFASAKDFGAFALDVAGQTWNDIGGRTLTPYRRYGIDDGDGAPTAIATLLRRLGPVSTVLAGQLRLSTNGDARRLRVAGQMVEAENAAARVTAREALEEMVRADSVGSAKAAQIVEDAAARYGWSDEMRAACYRRAVNGFGARARATPERDRAKIIKGAQKYSKSTREELEKWLDRGEY